MDYRIIITGLLLIANLFLSILYHVTPLDYIDSMHPFSNIEYEVSTFYNILHLYISVCLYPFILTVIKPDLNLYFKNDLIIIYMIYEFARLVDHFLFYQWTFINLDVCCPFLIAITVLYVTASIIKGR